MPPLEPAAHAPTRNRSSVWDLLWSRLARQAAGFAGASLLATALAVVATALLTRNLRTEEFGSYSFAVALLFFVALFFDFGLFSPAAQLAAVNPRERREIVGTALLVYLPVGAAFSATIYVLSFVVDSWFNVDAGNALRLSALPAIAFPSVLVVQRLAQGTDRLHVASVGTVLAQLLLVGALALAVGLSSLTTSSGLALRSFTLLLAMVASALWLRPLFGHLRRWVPELVKEARAWGLQAYVGRITSIGTYNMDVLMLGIWASPDAVGFYVLAASLAMASGLPVMAMATAAFAQMAREPAIPRRWIVIATVVGAVCAVTAWLLADPVIRLFFSDRYVAAAALVLPLALGEFVRGVTTLFNNFLSAHRRGREMRDAGLILTASNLVFNFALIPPFGASGAAWASLLALTVNLVGYVVFYRRSFAL
jgi:O-antigen/teichoic acid export membrane protein